jgi:hypothetical protein
MLNKLLLLQLKYYRTKVEDETIVASSGLGSLKLVCRKMTVSQPYDSF